MLENFEELRDRSPEFFAGANSADGFFSCFDDLYSPEKGDAFYILKGGPGTGKSTLMKRLALAADKEGDKAELFFCSSGPDSLDGVRFDRALAAVADGTAPHVMDPKFPGMCERIIPLGDCLDYEKLRQKRKELLPLYNANSALHKKASRIIRAAGSLCDDSFAVNCACVDFDRAADFGRRLCDRFLDEKQQGRGRERRAFLSGITPAGLVVFSKTPEKMCGRVVEIEDQYGGASSAIMSVIRKRALSCGLDIITCPCALHPERKIDHVLIPEKNIAFCTVNSHIKIGSKGKKIHMGRFTNTQKMREFSARIRFNKKASEELFFDAAKTLAQAKNVHDQIEEHYIESMDFNRWDGFCRDVFLDLSSRVKGN